MKFCRIRKSGNFVVRNIVVRNFVVLFRINSVHGKISFDGIIEQRYIFSPELIYRCALISPHDHFQNRNICEQGADIVLIFLSFQSSF